MTDWNDFDGIEEDWSEVIPPEFDDMPDPVFLGRADLLPSGELWADLYTDQVTGDYSLQDVRFDSIRNLLGIEDAEDLSTWADKAEALPFGFDHDDPDIRGPFFDQDAVNNFIDETGMYWADIYYDAESDEYFIDVSY